MGMIACEPERSGTVLAYTHVTAMWNFASLLVLSTGDIMGIMEKFRGEAVDDVNN
jgi:hypothetical protein